MHRDMMRLIASTCRTEAALDVHGEHFADMHRAIGAFVRMQLNMINATVGVTHVESNVGQAVE